MSLSLTTEDAEAKTKKKNAEHEGTKICLSCLVWFRPSSLRGLSADAILIGLVPPFVVRRVTTSQLPPALDRAADLVLRIDDADGGDLVARLPARGT